MIRQARRGAHRGRTLLLGTAGLLAALVACIWLVPGMLDWNRYRDGIATLAGAAIGRPVHITGGVTLHLLPQPILTASGITVDDAGDGIVLTADELRLRVALGPLLGGRVDARELTLRGAALRLPWPPPPGTVAQRAPSWLTGLQARLEDSRLQVGTLLLTGIDANLTSDPDTGTLSTAGEASMGGRPWHFTARLSRPGGDGAAGFEASLDGKGPLQDTGGTFSGQLAADGALTGRVQGRGPDLSQLMPGPAVPWRGDGRLSAAAGLAVADELALEIGGSPARGAVALRVQPEARLDLALAAGRIDLDAWLPVLMRAAQPGGFAGIPTGIDLSAEAATLAGGTLRRLRGGFDLDSAGVAVRDGTALLPGDARLLLSGRMPSRPGGPLFTGTAHLTTPDLRTTLAWLEPLAPAVIGAVPPNALNTADLGATLVIDAAQAALSDLRGTVDGSRVQGTLSLRVGPRMAVGASLLLDRLVADRWLPDPSTLGTPAGAQAALSRAGSFDADVKLQVQQASWRGAPLGPVTLDAQTEAGRVTLRRMEVAPFGIRVVASGGLGEGGRVTDGRLELSAQDVSPLRAVLPAAMLPFDPALAPGLLRGPANLVLLASGAPEALAARVTLDLGDLRVDLQPTVNLAARRWSGPLTLHHPGAPRLLELLGAPGTVAWLGDGSFSVVGQVNARPGRTEMTSLDVGAGALRGTGQLLLEKHAVSGHLAFENLPLPLPYPRSLDPLPIAGLRGWKAAVHVEAQQVLFGLTPALQEVSADLSLHDSALQVSDAAGKLSGGTVSASLALDAGADIPTLTAQVSVGGVGITGPLFGSLPDLTRGQLDAQVSFSAVGHSPAALLATMDGTGVAVVRSGVVSGFDLAAAAAALADPDRTAVMAASRTALQTGTTAFVRLEAPLRVQRGTVTGTAQLEASSGSASLSGTVDVLGGNEDLRLVLRPSTEGPEMAVRLTGAVAQPAVALELSGVARWLAGLP